MPRFLRYSSPGALHHVMLRGNQGRPIFYTDADRVQCCLLIQEGVDRFGHIIHGFCFMSNHIHLAWQEGNESISNAVQNLAFRYAQRVNYLRKEVGHVFQGRFKSILVDKSSYLTKLIRYIHLNPVRAGMVRRPEDYKWSGHNSYLGIDPITWVDRDYVLNRYSQEREIAIKQYNEFVYAGIGLEPEIDFKVGTQAGIIGDDVFIQNILESKSSMLVELAPTTIELVELLCAKYRVSLVDVVSQNKSRDLADLRAKLALFAKEIKGLTLADLAKVLNRDPGGLSRTAKHLESKCKYFPELRQEIESLKGELLGKYTESHL